MSRKWHILDGLSFSLFTDTYSPGRTPLIIAHNTHLVGVVLVVAYEDVSCHSPISLWKSLTQVEVVVLRVTDDNEAANKVGEGWAVVSIPHPTFACIHLLENLRMARAFLPFM